MVRSSVIVCKHLPSVVSKGRVYCSDQVSSTQCVDMLVFSKPVVKAPRRKAATPSRTCPLSPRFTSPINSAQCTRHAFPASACWAAVGINGCTCFCSAAMLQQVKRRQEHGTTLLEMSCHPCTKLRFTDLPLLDERKYIDAEKAPSKTTRF